MTHPSAATPATGPNAAARVLATGRKAGEVVNPSPDPSTSPMPGCDFAFSLPGADTSGPDSRRRFLFRGAGAFQVNG